MSSDDWIKMRTCLREEPEVVSLAAALRIEADAVVGKLHALWGWADRHTADGSVPGITARWVDEYLRCRGFAKELERVGWLVIADSGITLPKFDRHGGGDAKRRAQTARRLAKYRRKQRNANETHGALPSGENGDGEEEEEVEEDGDERSQEKEKSFRKFRKDFFPDMAPVDSDSNGKRMNPHERKKIAERGKLIMSQEPWCSLCKEILELKAEPLDENDPNTVRKVGILWEHKDLPADELRLRIQQARDRGRKKFAYFIGLVKKRIGNDLWDSYSN